MYLKFDPSLFLIIMNNVILYFIINWNSSIHSLINSYSQKQFICYHFRIKAMNLYLNIIHNQKPLDPL